VPGPREAADEEPESVDDRSAEDDVPDAELVAELPRGERGENVACRDDAEHRRRDVERLVEPVDDVEDDEGPHPREGRLPGRVGDQEAPHLLLATDDAPRRRKDRAETLEAGRLHVLLVDEHDHRATRPG
jgi:hypothetical protein